MQTRSVKFFAIYTLSIAILCSLAQIAFAQTGCQAYPSGASPAANYGASWDVFAPTRDLIVSSDCPTSGDALRITIGKGHASHMIWQNAYVYDSSASPARWATTTLSGTDAGDGWLSAIGSKTITMPFTPSRSNPLFYVGYICVNRNASGWKCGCANASCTSRYWQLQGYTGVAGTATTGGTTSSEPASGGGIVAKYGPRTVHFQANRTGGGFQERYRFTPADQYYLDYTLRFHDRFDWDTRPQVQGKIPGLAGGGQNGGGNCTGSAPDAWSARSMFHQDGAMKAYLYYSNKTSTCGDKEDWIDPNGGGIFKFTKNRYYRFTQRIKINTPNVSNGEIEIWIDGQRVFYRNNMRWRGDVSSSVARVDQVMYQAFFGGESINHTPTYDSSMDFGWMYVMSCAPDFSKAPGNC